MFLEENQFGLVVTDVVSTGEIITTLQEVWFLP